MISETPGGGSISFTTEESGGVQEGIALHCAAPRDPARPWFKRRLIFEAWVLLRRPWGPCHAKAGFNGGAPFLLGIEVRFSELQLAPERRWRPSEKFCWHYFGGGALQVSCGVFGGVGGGLGCVLWSVGLYSR